MPLPIILGGFGLVGAALLVAIALWPQVLQWAEESVFPWFEENVPEMADLVREAFVQVDRVATAVRRAAKKAWHTLREILYLQVVKYRKQNDGVWVRIVESWLQPPGEEKVQKQTTTEVVDDMDDLPDEVREALIRRKKIDETKVTEVRDQEILELTV